MDSGGAGKVWSIGGAFCRAWAGVDHRDRDAFAAAELSFWRGAADVVFDSVHVWLYGIRLLFSGLAALAADYWNRHCCCICCRMGDLLAGPISRPRYTVYRQ